jgi:hypothetical protein
MLIKRFCMAVLTFGVTSFAVNAGQTEVINPPNIVVIAPSTPVIAPVAPAVSQVGTVATTSSPGPSAEAGQSSNVVGVSLSSVAGFDVSALSAPQMQAAAATIQSLIQSGALTNAQSAVLQQQLTQIQSSQGQ